MRVVLVHDWLNGMRGGEKCLEVFCELFSESPIYTLFHEKGKVSHFIESHPIHVSWLQKMPGLYKHYRRYLPVYPVAVKSLRLPDCDLVISMSHCAAKAVQKPKGASHLCYCFTPMRYAWDLFDEYFGDKPAVQKGFIRAVIERLKRWDLKTSEGVDSFVAISKHVAERIKRCYRRDSAVIYPPVDTDFYDLEPLQVREDFYLIVSALVPYKRVDLAVEAFNRLGRPVVIIGDGPQSRQLQKGASAHVRFLGWLSNEELRRYYQRAKALIFPQEEDFGIVPLEMQACGGAVIAYAKGGSLETVKENETGIFFKEQRPECLMEAVLRFEKQSWNPARSRQASLAFGRNRFKQEILSLIQKL